MKAQGLLAHYARIADAPDAIARLRRFVLDLAVRGKLVEQERKDEPSPDLLRLVGKEVKGQIQLPQGWHSASVGTLLNFQYGKGLKASERLEQGPIPVYGSNGIVGYTDQPLTTRSAIVVGRKGSAGALNLCDGGSWTTDVAFFVEAPTYFHLRFLKMALEALDLDKLGKGVKPGLSRSDAYEQILFVPPLAEQHRIVVKVDELMALCDRLEAARAEREATRDRLAAASLGRLNTPDPDTFPADARFALAALPALTSRPDQIKQLRQTILNLAVRGKLVPQDPRDEPASDLLKKINLLKQSGRDRAHEASREHDEQRPLRELPDSWVLVQLSDVAKIGTGATPSRARPDYFQPAEIPWITSGETSSAFIHASAQFVSRKALAETNLSIYPVGTLVVAMYGQGKTRGQVAELCIEATVNQACAAIELLLDDECHRRFLKLFFQRNYSAIREQAAGGPQPNLNLGKIGAIRFPLPPLTEQHRIVAKVDELMALCDQLEASLTTGEATRRRLLDALLHEALAPAESLAA